MDLYQILGVHRQASISEISSAYRNLAKIYHPDKPTGDQDKFKSLVHAYTILSDPKTRHTYDTFGTTDNIHRKNCVNLSTNNQLFNNQLFNDIFGQIFTVDNNQTAPPIIHLLDVDIKDIYVGCTKSFTYNRQLLCHCGIKPNISCLQCNNLGLIAHLSTQDIIIHPGARHNTEIKFKGLGNDELHKQRGDLVVSINLINNTPYRIVGDNLEINIDISLYDALNGVDKEITFVDNSIIKLTTPNGQTVKTDTHIIYPSSGMPCGDHTYGDLLVKYNIVLPNKMPSNINKKLLALAKCI